MKWSKEMAKVLDDAFEVCWLTQYTLGDVMAGSEVPEASDIKYYNLATGFIDWYLKAKQKQ